MKKANDVKWRMGENEFFNFDFLGDSGRASNDFDFHPVIKKPRKKRPKKVSKIKHEKRF